MLNIEIEGLYKLDKNDDDDDLLKLNCRRGNKWNVQIIDAKRGVSAKPSKLCVEHGST
jgi:hypothetical protein